MRFRNQVVVITGAAGGIGLATAKAFASEGAQVVITDLKPDSVADAVRQVDKEGGHALGLTGDVSDPSHVDANVEEIMDRFGRVDVLVNNAGIMHRAPTEEMPRDAWRRVLTVNLDGPFYWAQAVAVRSMIPNLKGSIVNIASIGGIVAFPTAAPYVASKHGVIGLTKILAVDWGKYNIRVNALCPGMTWGSELSRADVIKNPDHFVERESRIPLGQAAQPEVQAKAALFLASEDASYASGLIMNMDGGQLALSSGHSAPRNSGAAHSS
ncbi:SDR family oxidoreductase [Rhodococcus sp. WS1]|uniref:SDR family NAD(P)-dependent oxidoreductase n=1 Tax=unclassified Rhodococcus (in: high G+C Gram-positive bacteria) TaxID=192944 RepID=UPI0011438174|nr:MULTISPECIES: SDR family NAD(P)-dependent oxidoreductase [unclassified Rhodococcus (in: high G+C Gram-positive bacteria)]ROZ52938.1 SDR family oxidoreductase [Rhodococcus sp. WS1]TQC36028.1 SDR family oxidoreductase [Rhodococcus sp. WS7]